MADRKLKVHPKSRSILMIILNRTKIFVALLLAAFTIWFLLFRESREERLMRRGNAIVEKIEQFKSSTGRLPFSLEEMKVEEEEGADALYYQRRDSNSYIASFGTILGESMIYYSDSKAWEDINR